MVVVVLTSADTSTTTVKAVSRVRSRVTHGVVFRDVAWHILFRNRFSCVHFLQPDRADRMCMVWQASRDLPLCLPLSNKRSVALYLLDCSPFFFFARRTAGSPPAVSDERVSGAKGRAD